MADAFDLAAAFVLEWEGGLADVPEDRGGRTRYGISSAAHPDIDIDELDLPAALAIYRRDYWDAIRCDELPTVVGLVAFDGAVHAGAPRSARWIQTVVGTTPDGVVGPKTLASVAGHAARRSPRWIALEHIRLRLAHMDWMVTRWSDQKTFEVGWRRRVLDLAAQVGASSTN